MALSLLVTLSLFAVSLGCNRMYFPVCGSNGITYINPCFLEEASKLSDQTITRVHNGPCEQTAYSTNCQEFRCTKNLKFVCGDDGNTYANECVMKRNACIKQKAITKVHEGKCGQALNSNDCPKVCPSIFAPVCGDDGVSYDNKCQLKAAACSADKEITVAHTGHCSDELSAEDCPLSATSCPKIWFPVCGDNGVTYPNPCVMQVAACMDKMDITIAHHGLCADQLSAQECPKVCPSVFAPVCGDDGVSYDNKCLLEAAACSADEEISVAHRGLCSDKLSSEDCPKVCPRLWAPVCGDDGVSYDNKCLLKAAACSADKEITVAHTGRCSDELSAPKCNLGCPKIWAPVCSDNGVTFPNKCLLEVAACIANKEVTIAHRGPCADKLNAQECPKVCPSIFAPVCGDDGVSYDNKCQLKAAACSENKEISIAHTGHCSDELSVKDCRKSCPKLYAPVCSDNGVTYPNKCVMEIAACIANKEITIAHRGPCADKLSTQECPKVCPSVFAPVCGDDGVSYDNKCLLKAAACSSDKEISVAHAGSCSEKLSAQECPKVCPRIFAPVCGDDGVSYDNKCLLKAAACSADKEITVAHTGRCSDELSSEDCPKVCPRLWAPVCGDNGVSYDNECLLKAASCSSNTKINKISDGLCHW